MVERSRMALMVNFYLGYYNMDIFGVDVTNTEHWGENDHFDIVFFLSMGYHVGLPEWTMKIADELFIYEGNARITDKAQIDSIISAFPYNKEIGTSNDLSERRVVWGMKTPEYNK
jgi:hypothetical protein